MSEADDTPETLTYDGGFKAVVARMQAREKPLSFSRGEALPGIGLDFAPLKAALVQELDPKDIPRAKDQSGNTRKSLELNAEFIGQPELCKLHGLLIAHLRKSGQPAQSMALFTRMWDEEAEFLFRHLDPRWLVSAITTFGDHGTTEVQRRVGTSMSVLFAAMKLYESERLYSGFAPDKEFKLKRLVNSKLPLNMDRYALVSGGLDVNMLARLWLDAEQDCTIAPLAHRLLDLLNADPGTVFRRFATLRGRKMRQRSAKDDATEKADAEPEPAPPARAKDHSWATVSTIKAEAAKIAPFIAHHLGLGAAHLHIFLDAPLPAADRAALAHPKVTLTTCDVEYWQASGKPRMEKHQQRQAFNATRAYRAAQSDWLAHIDCDEFLYPQTTVPDTLNAAPLSAEALIMPPAEEIAQSSEDAVLLFRRTYFDAGCNKSVLDALYPTFGAYLRSGFISHTVGKTMARTGLSDARFGVHLLKRGGVEVKNAKRVQSLNVLHRHAPDWPGFERHLAFRLSQGSYRDRGQSRLGLGEIIDILIEDHGTAGPKKLFDEVCAARPDVIETLEKHRMLIRTTLKTTLREYANV
ncbi:glycosyltransferase family 2 protein [Planktotalea arctica]|uniref:glycosyltransferase family 2 protein n=1 Tax=Planktotalea arctica TaxID=1481893 RepID=UPI00321B6CB0